MRLPTSPRSPIVWFGMLGAPISWGLQFTIGYWISEAHCSVAGESWSIEQDAASTVVTIVALVAGLAAALAAIGLLVATRGVEKDDDPPAGRVHFMATVGIAVAPLFLILIVMTGAGVLELSCNQS